MRSLAGVAIRKQILAIGCAAMAVLAALLTIAGALAQSGGTASDPAIAAAAVAAVSVPLVPAPPQDARAGKVYVMFDALCARCHQNGKLKVPVAARPMANILALDDIAQEPTLVTPGIPDASPLYTVLLRQHPALELDTLPDADGIQSVRDWISDLAPSAGTCRAQAGARQADSERAIVAALAAVDEDKRKDLRFVTLGHLADACVAADTIAAYRQAITKLINTLYWGPEPLRLATIDERRTILKLDLSELGWVPAHWDKLVQAYPYANLAASRLSETVRRQTGTTTPLVRGDWLAHAATATPLYARLLGLPGRFANLQRILNVDIEAGIATGKARRAGLTQSAVTRGNRLVERHPTRAGSLWIAYDFATSEGRQNLLSSPLGPTATANVRVPFKHDGTRSLFTLPNGFFAYSLNDTRGDRLEISPETVDRDEVSWGGPAVNGASCMACHATGPLPVKDAVRSVVEGDTSLLPAVRDQALQLYVAQAEIDTLVSEDQERYAGAQRKAGIDPQLLVGGLEPVTALAREYTRDVGLTRLAAESGLTIAETRARFVTLPAELAPSTRRIRSTTASRAEADRILIRLAPDAGTVQAALVVASQPEARTDLELLLWSQAEVYEPGQLATFYARSNQACYLTLISLDRGGQATILFPNEFEQNNLLNAETDLTLPAASASYQFRVRDKGRETLVGICNTSTKTPAGIQHDFERQRFTTLGDWRAYLAQLPPAGPKVAAASEQPRPRPQRRTRNRPQSAPPAAAEPKADPKTMPDLQARAAITYEVR